MTERHEDRFFNQIVNPTYEKDFRDELTEIYRLGKSLVTQAPDEQDFDPAIPGNPKVSYLSFDTHSLMKADLYRKFDRASLSFLEEVDTETEAYPESLSFGIRYLREVDNVTKIRGGRILRPTLTKGKIWVTRDISFSPDMDDPTDLAFETDSAFHDLRGNRVLPGFDQSEDRTLHAIGDLEGIDLQGAKLIEKLIQVEAELRGITL